MLTLIIAAPRTGKSQLSVSKMVDYRKQGKRVFTTNFNQTPQQREELGIEEFPDATKWWEEMPHGSVWFIDEAQDIIPQRDKHTQLPEWIKLFSKHGHHDLTIYVITQDAMQLDVHMRRNTNLTLYMTRPLNLSRALIYTFRGYQEIPNDAWRRSQVLKSAESKKKFKYSKKWQRLYVSASAHEHIKIRFPLKLLILPIAAILVIWLLITAWNRLKGRAGSDDTPASDAAAALIGAVAPSAAAGASGESAPETPEQWASKFNPRFQDIPWSAPAYDGFEVTDYPRPYCWIGHAGCRCVTQQMSSLDISDKTCRHYVQNGYFDPFQKAPATTGVQAAQNVSDRGLSSDDATSHNASYVKDTSTLGPPRPRPSLA